MPNRLLCALLFTLALPLAVAACIWDYDTLKMERQRFPGTLEVITGKFLRHSPAFYEWRVKDRLAKIDKDPSLLSNYDDLAVAYHKLGQTEKAIEWMQKKDKLKPGLYETEANLSAFYMLSGQWEKGLEHVNKALAINPNAHFGREKYQKYLAEYVLMKMKANGGKLPLPMEDYKTGNFGTFLVARGETSSADAVKAVSGMIIFACPEAPMLQEALGDVLLLDYRLDREGDAKQLSSLALLRAASLAPDDQTRAAYRKRATEALSLQIPPSGEKRRMTIEELKPRLEQELHESGVRYARIQADESHWITEGKNPEKEFDQKYYQEPSASPEAEPTWLAGMYREFNMNQGIYVLRGILVGIVVLVALTGFLLYRRWKRSNVTSGVTS